MNKLTGFLLHEAFELGPFEQKDLVQACLALPALARFWLKTKNRAQGFCVRKTADFWGKHGEESFTSSPCKSKTQVLGLIWNLDSDGCLCIWQYEQNKLIYSLYFSWFEAKIPPLKTLEGIMNWIQEIQARGNHVRMVMKVFVPIGADNSILGKILDVPVSRLKDTKMALYDLQRTGIEIMVRALIRGSLFRHPLLDQLARMALENPRQEDFAPPEIQDLEVLWDSENNLTKLSTMNKP